MTALNSYLGTLLWSETLFTDNEESITTTEPAWSAGEQEDGAPLDSFIDASDLKDLKGGPELIAEAEADLADFASHCEESLGFDPFEVFDAEQVAHDFALSRNGHGAGFFDGDYTHGGKQRCNDLQAAAKTFGTFGLSVWVHEGRTCINWHG